MHTNGEEVPTVEAAKREELIALGDAARDFARAGGERRLSIRVRDQTGAILEVSATFEAKRLR